MNTLRLTFTRKQDVPARIVKFNKLWTLNAAKLSRRKRGGVLCSYREVEP